MMKNKTNHNFNRSFHFADDIINGDFQLTVRGQHELLIQNYASLLECKESCIQIKCHKNIIQITGEKLKIKYFYDSDCVIEGYIQNIQFLESKN